MRKKMLAALFGLMISLSPSLGWGADGIDGVKGGLTLVEKNSQNANKKESIQVPVGDKIEIIWTYPIVPGGFPSQVSARSNNSNVKFLEILSVTEPRKLGVGTLGAFYSTDKLGKSTLEFLINGKNNYVLVVEVEVVAKP